MTSTDDLASNLDAARELVGSAARQGAEFVALPENFAFLRREGRPIPCAQGLDGEIVGALRGREFRPVFSCSVLRLRS